MRILLQRVSEARVDVAGECVGRIGPGLLLFVGAAPGDTSDDVRYIAEKIANLRIFGDEYGKMNVSVLDKQYEVLVVSQFTLHANIRKGRRPSFTDAAGPEIAEPLVEALVEELRRISLSVETGRFGAEMEIRLVNDGPVTIWMDTDDLRR